VLLVLAACTGQKGGFPSPDKSSVTVEVKNLRFVPYELRVKRGTTVVWLNRDGFAHTVTFSDGSFDKRLEKGGSITRSFSEPGRYEYTCKIHRSMKGVVIVE
jgi:plastocyanin